MASKRQTIQRTLVLNAVRASDFHPTADEVYETLRSAHPTISKATVYRNLGQLSQDGEIRMIEMPDASNRYDRALNPHYHVKCRVCGRIEDLPQAYQSELDQLIALSTGYGDVAHSTLFTGTCANCRP